MLAPGWRTTRRVEIPAWSSRSVRMRRLAGSSARVPAQNRPWGSQAASFIRVPAGATSATFTVTTEEPPPEDSGGTDGDEIADADADADDGSC